MTGRLAMRGRAGVPVTVEIFGVEQGVVRFSLDAVAGWVAALHGAPQRGQRSGRGTLARRVAAAAPRIIDELEEAWSRLGLRGAALVYEPAPDSPMRRARVATDPLLVVNVLARARGGLLLPGTPPALDEAHLGRVLATDDPRLCRRPGR